MGVYSPDLSKKLLLYECTGRVCGEVKTLRAHPVWDGLCPVACALNFFTHRYKQTNTHRFTFTLWIIIPYVLTVW